MRPSLSGFPGTKRRILTHMDKYPAGQLSVFSHAPSSPAREIHFVLSLPGKLDPLSPTIGIHPAIHLTLDQSK
jgi:hypothetical protein